MFREEMQVLGLPGAEDVTDGSVDYYDMDWENVENGVTRSRWQSASQKSAPARRAVSAAGTCRTSPTTKPMK